MWIKSKRPSSRFASACGCSPASTITHTCQGGSTPPRGVSTQHSRKHYNGRELVFPAKRVPFASQTTHREEFQAWPLPDRPVLREHPAFEHVPFDGSTTNKSDYVVSGFPLLASHLSIRKDSGPDRLELIPEALVRWLVRPMRERASV
jgi:hypothetical protein